jgi:iron complex outermembrane receptor protein
MTPVEPDQVKTCEGKASPVLRFFAYLHIRANPKFIIMKWICFFSGLLIFSFLHAQTSTLRGRISSEGKGLEGASIVVTGPTTSKIISSANGSFVIGNLPAGKYTFSSSFTGFTTNTSTIELPHKGEWTIEMLPLQTALQPVEIRGIRAADNAPFTKTNISKAVIEKYNTGQDIPFLLNQTPNVVVNSDAGNGIGYTGIRIRGSDGSRINMTINGIPYNDAESQGAYFVDLPDFLSSTSSIQIQRGVGTSSNGAGAFGASMNFSTHEYNAKSYAELHASAGSFNSYKTTLKFGSGLIGKHFTIDGRLSKIGSDGFIDRASTNLTGAYFNVAYWGKTSTLKFNAILGKEKTYQAWNGIPEAKLKGDDDALLNHYYNNVGYLYNTPADSINLFDSDDRKYNVFTYKNQTDNYWQNHYQLFWTKEINKALSFNTALYLSTGKGYYEEYKYGNDLADYGLSDSSNYSDLIRRLWLKNYLYGQIFSLQYKQAKNEVTLGGGWSRYDNNHYGKVIWTDAKPIFPEHEYYDLDAHKTDINVYAKWLHKLSDTWGFFADVQYRYVQYEINGFRNNPGIHINETWNFVNPKAGISFEQDHWSGYLSYAVANKEPNRDDFEAGVNQLPTREQLHDFELNVLRKNLLKGWNVGATFYYMKYKDQLVLTGKINDVGSYTRTNIPKSFRAGVELETQYQWSFGSLRYSVGLSSNKLQDFTEYVDDYDNGGQLAIDHGNSNIALSPSVVQFGAVQFNLFRNGTIEWLSKYVGKQFLDNSSNDSRSQDAYFVNDLRLAYTIPFKKGLKDIGLSFQLNNIFDVKYEPNGYTYSYYYGGNTITENFYYPMAGTNFMFALSIRL